MNQGDTIIKARYDWNEGYGPGFMLYVTGRFLWHLHNEHAASMPSSITRGTSRGMEQQPRLSAFR